MNVLPDAKVQALSECEPGQLVRDLTNGLRGRLGVVCEIEDADLPGIIYFADGPPTFEGRQYDLTVLAYSGDLVWEIGHEGPVEPYAGELFSRGGCVICNTDGWFMNVVVEGYPIPRRTQLNIKTGRVGLSQQWQGIAIFGAWEAFLEDKGRPFAGRIKVASFNVRDTDEKPL